jgi:hypothetical protein
MSSVSEHEHLDPNDPEYYAPPRLRKKSQCRLSLSQEARSEPVKATISLTASLDTQLENAVSDVLWHPLDPEVIHEPAGLARESDRRAALISFAAAVGVSAVVALFLVIMLVAPRQSDAASTSSEIIRSMRTALPQSGQGDDGSKPALAEFQAILASAPASQPATHEQSDQLLQQFLQWRQKPNSTETSK